MKSIYTELDLYGSKNECARTENVFSPISEVCYGTVYLWVFTKRWSPAICLHLRHLAGLQLIGLLSAFWLDFEEDNNISLF